ncbi:Tetraspanin-13 [Fasciola hepatica]|uniref:Tetraspanin-13 n=1 Tax=Fasciola hepatica TaxID=6192 RepID=A0A4E0RJV0_FASHE|nr:Tetraspanin-13 [Fasciola hepatica]
MNFLLIRHILLGLNIMYLGISFILIGLAAYVRLSAYVTSIGVVGGIIACGVFLAVLAIVGLIGTMRHSQAVLFFYIILLFSLFLIQFSVACACLALSTEDQRSIVSAAWARSPTEAKIDMMRGLQCCGFRRRDLPSSDLMGHPPCKLAQLPCCEGEEGRYAICCQGSIESHWTNSSSTTCPCSTTCWSVVEQKLERGTRLTGTVSLLFSVVEVADRCLAGSSIPPQTESHYKSERCALASS